MAEIVEGGIFLERGGIGQALRSHDFDAVVRVTNRTFLEEVGDPESRGVDQVAGTELLHACRGLGAGTAGDARITAGYSLSIPNIIHIIGPAWEGPQETTEPLRACYRSALQLAQNHAVQRIAFPGSIVDVSRDDVADWRWKEAFEFNVHMAVQMMREWMTENEMPRRVTVFCDGGGGHWKLKTYLQSLREDRAAT
jgi:O-acetyl-ADP-ribose deacetylase (regulator of RNase III)